MTTPIWLTGFEYGVATPVTNGSGIADWVDGTPTIQDTIKRSGSYALKIDPTAATEAISKNISGTPTIVVGRFYFYFGTLPSATIDRIFSVDTTAYYIHCAFGYDQSVNKLYANIGSSGDTYWATTLAVDTWYRVDFRANCSGTTWTMDWQVNGVAQTQVSIFVGAADTFATTNVGVQDTGTCVLYFDDIVMSATTGDYPIGAGQVDALLPTSDGTHNNSANVMEDASGNDIDGATYFAYQQVDEVPMSETTTRIQQSTAGTTKYVEIQFADQASAYTAYHGVIGILAYMSASTATNQGGCVVRDNTGTETPIWGNSAARADYSESSMYYKSAIVTVPAGGWTQAEINALRARMGYSNDVSPVPYWCNLLLEVAHSGVEVVVGQPVAPRYFGIPTRPHRRAGGWN
jgi:hypothetical protein